MTSIVPSRSYIEARQAAAADAASAGGITQITVTPERDTGKEFFGEDGLSFRDVLDAINPLNHIPIVSGLLEDATGHKPSVASKIAGGALFGPIGLVASLANVIFEQQTGHDVGGTMVAALSGDSAPEVEVAAAAKAQEEQVAAADTAIDKIEVASLDTQALNIQSSLASTAPSAGSNSGDAKDDKRNRAVLDLFGASAAPTASRAYQKAQLLPYLKEANHTQVL